MAESMAAGKPLPPVENSGVIAVPEPNAKHGLFRHIPVSDRIPLAQKIVFGASGNINFLASDLTTGVFLMPFFNIGLGISPVSLGILLMALRIFDALLDPFMGNLTDNARTRWGRRRPFMAVGAVLVTIFYLLIWHPPTGLSENGTLFYLFAIGVPFFASCTLWNAPFAAMSMELTPNYDERTRLSAWGALFGKIFGLLGGWSMAIVTCPWFVNPATGKPDIVRGMQAFSLLIAGLVIVLGLLPAIIGRERYYKAEVMRQTKDPIWQGLKESAHCQPLWAIIGASFFLTVGYASISTLGQYVNIYLVNGGRIADASIVTGWKACVIVATGITCIPLWTWLGEKFEKLTIVTVMISISFFGHCLYLFCMRPDHPYYQLFPACFEAGAISAAWIFFPSMRADIADYDELQTTRRREASLNAFLALFCKAASTLAMGLGGVLLQFSGFSAKFATQSPEVLHRMLVIFVAVPLICYGVTLVLLRTYPLTRQRMEEIRAMLEERRGKM